MLPPAERTSCGYRRLDERHRAALLTYRALAGGYGWGTAGAVMRAVHAADVAGALALVDAAHAGVHGQRQALHAVLAALESVARTPATDAAQGSGPVPRSGLYIGEVAARLGVRVSALRVWESAGLLRPGREAGTRYRRYHAADVRDARVVAMLRQGRYPLAQIGPILDGLRRSGSTEALREATARRQAELTARSTAMLYAAGHLHGYLTGQGHDAPRPPLA